MDALNFRIDRDCIDLAYLLDTSAAILLRDDDLVAKTALAQLDQVPLLSAVSLVELEGGVYARPAVQAQRRRRLDALLEVIEVLDFTTAMAQTYGRIVRLAGFSRRKIIDRMIAATAIECDLTVITANPEDFSDIDRVQVIAWQA